MWSSLQMIPTKGKRSEVYDIGNSMRESLIKSYREKVIAHAAANGGCCHWGFVNGLADGATEIEVAPFMKITCDNIKDKVRDIQAECKQLEVSLLIAYLILSCTYLSANLDSCVSLVQMSRK